MCGLNILLVLLQLDTRLFVVAMVLAQPNLTEMTPALHMMTAKRPNVKSDTFARWIIRVLA
jgi:hypothetical protein